MRALEPGDRVMVLLPGGKTAYGRLVGNYGRMVTVLLDTGETVRVNFLRVDRA